MKYVITLCPKCGKPLFNGETICLDCLCIKPKHKRKEILIKPDRGLSKIKIKTKKMK